MSLEEPPSPCYLVEWYRPAGSGAQLARTTGMIDAYAASMSAAGSRVHLLAVVVVPSDEVIFGVFAADSEADVAETCRQAGMAAQRVTAALGLGGAALPLTE
jgi:hypothetical protein